MTAVYLTWPFFFSDHLCYMGWPKSLGSGIFSQISVISLYCKLLLPNSGYLYAPRTNVLLSATDILLKLPRWPNHRDSVVPLDVGHQRRKMTQLSIGHWYTWLDHLPLGWPRWCRQANSTDRKITDSGDTLDSDDTDRDDPLGSLSANFQLL